MHPAPEHVALGAKPSRGALSPALPVGPTGHAAEAGGRGHPLDDGVFTLTPLPQSQLL